MLRTRLVFIDTCTFQSRNFQFLQYILDKVRVFCDEGKIRILVTDILIGEVKKHIVDITESTYKQLTQAKKDLQILRNMPDLEVAGIFRDKSTLEEQKNRLLENFDIFLSASSIENVSLNKANLDDVFLRYFNVLPPFGKGKKDEIPDAVNISVLESVSTDRQMPIYVVSSDNDMITSCDDVNLISLKTLEELVDLVIRTEQELSEPVTHADLLFNQFEAQITQMVTDRMREMEFLVPFMQNAYVNNSYVESCVYSSKNIVDIDSDSTTYNLTFDVVVKVNVFESDYDRSPWDAEDERYVFILHNEHVIECPLQINASVEIYTVEGLRQMAELGDLDTPSIIELPASECKYIDFIEHWLDND